MDFKDATMIVTIIGDMMFLAKIKQGENVGYARFIKINVDVSKISRFRSEFGSFVAMYSNWFGRWANVGNMVRITEKIDSRLAVNEEKIFVDSCTGGMRCIGKLGQDDHTLFITCFRSIISVHSMNLLWWRLLADRAHRRGMTKLATGLASNRCGLTS